MLYLLVILALWEKGTHQETTAGAGHDLSFDGTVDPPTWGGVWNEKSGLISSGFPNP